MHILLAAFGAAAGDRQGYRWLWRADSLSDGTLTQILARLDTARFADAGPLRRLLARELDAGVFTLPEARCVAYRFLHGGRDGSREKFHLQVVVFPRHELTRLDLLALLLHPALSSMQETCPANPSVELPLHLGVPAADSPLADSVARCWIECKVLPQGRSFHLRLTGPVNAPVAELRVEPVPSAVPQSSTKPAALSVAPQATGKEKWQQPIRWRIAIAFSLGLVVGLLIGHNLKRTGSETKPDSPAAHVPSTRPPAESETNRGAKLTNNAVKLVTPKDTSSGKP